MTSDDTGYGARDFISKLPDLKVIVVLSDVS